jgi:hypothetical protein
LLRSLVPSHDEAVGACFLWLLIKGTVSTVQRLKIVELVAGLRRRTTVLELLLSVLAWLLLRWGELRKHAQSVSYFAFSTVLVLHLHSMIRS